MTAMTPKTKSELKRMIQDEYDLYVAYLQVLAREVGIHPGHGYITFAAQDHPDTKDKAAAKYRHFQAIQDLISKNYWAYVEAPKTWQADQKEYERVIHNIESQMDAVEFELSQAKNHQKQMILFDKKGIIKYDPTDESDELNIKLKDIESRLETLKVKRSYVSNEAKSELDNNKQILEDIRPGSTDDDSGDMVSESNPHDEMMRRWKNPIPSDFRKVGVFRGSLYVYEPYGYEGKMRVRIKSDGTGKFIVDGGDPEGIVIGGYILTPARNTGRRGKVTFVETMGILVVQGFLDWKNKN